MFRNRRHFRELLTESEEGIVSNILADRLKKLVDEKMLVRSDDPTHKQKGIYSLTEKAIQLVPILAALGVWGRRHLSVIEEHGMHSEVLEKGGPELWQRFMEELRRSHLTTKGKPLSGPSVVSQMQQAYECTVPRKRKRAGRVA